MFSNLLNIKLNYFKKQQKIVLTFPSQGNNTGPKWQLSTQKARSMSQMHGTRLLSTPGQF